VAHAAASRLACAVAVACLAVVCVAQNSGCPDFESQDPDNPLHYIGYERAQEDCPNVPYRDQTVSPGTPCRLAGWKIHHTDDHGTKLYYIDTPFGQIWGEFPLMAFFHFFNYPGENWTDTSIPGHELWMEWHRAATVDPTTGVEVQLAFDQIAAQHEFSHWGAPFNSTSARVCNLRADWHPDRTGSCLLDSIPDFRTGGRYFVRVFQSYTDPDTNKRVVDWLYDTPALHLPYNNTHSDANNPLAIGWTDGQIDGTSIDVARWWQCIVNGCFPFCLIGDGSCTGGDDGTAGATAGGKKNPLQSAEGQTIKKSLESLFEPNSASTNRVKEKFAVLSSWGPFGALYDLARLQEVGAQEPAPATITAPTLGVDSRGNPVWSTGVLETPVATRSLGTLHPMIRQIIGFVVYLSFFGLIVRIAFPKGGA